MAHGLLERQLRSLGLDRDRVPTAEEWRAILDRVSDAYGEADKSRKLAEHALAVTSAEMREMYAEAMSVRRVMTEELDTLHNVFHHIESGLCTLSPDGRVTLMNPGAERLLGWTEAELMGQPVLDLFSTSDDEEAETGSPGFVDPTTEFRELNGFLTRKNDERVPIAFSLTPIDDRPDAGAVLFFWDNSVQEDSHSELVRAKNDAEAATEAKTDFLVSMSQELRTPMNTVIGFTELLETTSLDEVQQKFARGVRSGADSLLALLNDVLDYSRIESGKITLADEPYEVRACVEDVLDLFAVRAAEKGVELAYTQSRSVPQVVVGDVNRLRQILVNLVSNALRSTDSGQIVVDVRAVTPKANDDADPRIRLKMTVRDTGCGISADHQERLFEAFNHDAPGTLRRLNGTGIGLAICKRLTDLMGGSISVRSRGIEGKGSAFTFTIVTRVSTDIAHMNDVAEVPDFASKRLLVVEDNEVVRGWLADQARNWGFRVTVAAGAEEARVLAAEGGSVDLAFVDESLPGDDADTLIDRLTTGAADRSIPVVGLTVARAPGAPGPEWADRCAVTIRKPVRLTEYWNTMAVLLMSDLAEAAMMDTSEATKPTCEPFLAESMPLRILVAEDDSVNQRVTAHMLERFGYACDEVSDGDAVLDALRENDYDLILMDLRMPERRGMETAECIRDTIDAAKRPAIIAVTASVVEEERERCLAAGMLDYVSKPVRTETLKRALVRAFDACRERPDAAA